MPTQTSLAPSTIDLTTDDEDVTYECYDLGVSNDEYERLLVAMAEVKAERARVVCRIDTRRERAPFVMPAVPLAA